MNILETIEDILCEILDIEKKDIKAETYLIRDLGAESIDLLEISVYLNQHFAIEVNEDDLFLRKLRIFLDEAEENNTEKNIYLKKKYSFLDDARISEILSDIDNGPVLKVKDLTHYVTCQQ
ncbi:phosphopantetheine-binding protein [Candidatus Magnetomorum sp. HK-1]|nr:phosphopantetheine-binding protein [Candidatus Magnetomorum sp. HK-1]